MNKQNLLKHSAVSSDDLTEDFYRDTIFTRIDFSAKVLRDKEFYKCVFDTCTFYKTKLSSCEFENCTFEHCDHSLWQVQGNKLVDCTFTNAKLVGVDWAGLRSPSRINFFSCILNNNIFLKLNLTGISIVQCTVKDADFSESNMTKAVLTECDFSGSRFQQTNLTQADLSDSFNYQINPNSVKLKKTVFTMPGAMALLQGFDIIIK